MSERTLATELGSFVLEAAAGIPDSARAAARRIVLDCLGAMLGGAPSKAFGIVGAYLTSSGGRGASTIVTIGHDFSAEHAALANGLAGHALDIDDTSRTMAGHPSVPALAASLAMAEETRRSGRELLDAFTIGFEVQAKLALAMPRNLPDLGWHNAGTIGTIGATASAAFLARLDSRQIVNAIGISGSMASGLTSNVGSMVKPLHPGLAARNGVLATQLAAIGMWAQPHALDGPGGFVQAYGGGPDVRIDLDAFAGSLGNPFDVAVPGTDFKIYPSCNCTHAAIDAALALRPQIHRPADITDVICRIPHLPSFLLDHRPPRNGTEGKFSLEYCVALALLKGGPDLEDFEDGPIENDEVGRLMGLVRVIVAEGGWKNVPDHGLPAEVTVTTGDGKRLSRMVDSPKGSAVVPLSESEIDSKFISLATRALPASQARELLDTIRQVDQLPSLAPAARLLVSPTGT
jgi:2-methylcitrate dehydratase PrpD